MKIIFFGPPGSGKGTQAKLISNEFKLFHLSTGDILRDKLKDEDEISIQLKKTISSGNLVSDNILNQIIGKKLTSNDCANGFILDGYPRTMAQLEFLLSFLIKNNLSIDFIFDFKIEFKFAEERILQRFKKEKRSDDSVSVIKTRLQKYMKETFPASQYFSSNFKDNYFLIDASQDVSQIQRELMKILKKGLN